jgi:catechol 2,3-dioxygenase-like lactoylglutathione lyase family enzyme
MEAIVKIKAVVETAICVDDLQAAETFYHAILGLPVIGKEPGRHVFFQVGEASVLLAFLAEATFARLSTRNCSVCRNGCARLSYCATYPA